MWWTSIALEFIGALQLDTLWIQFSIIVHGFKTDSFEDYSPWLVH